MASRQVRLAVIIYQASAKEPGMTPSPPPPEWLKIHPVAFCDVDIFPFVPYFLHLFWTKKTTCTLLAGVDYTTPATHPAANCLKSPVNRFTDYSGKMMGLLPTTRKYYRNRQLYLTLLYRNRSGLYSTVYLCIGCNICRKFRRWECTVYMYTYTKDICIF
jgi:hypothetical protein